MAIAILPRLELEALHTTKTRKEITEIYPLEEHDIEGLEQYYCLPPRGAGVRHKASAVDVNALADELWQIIQPRIEKMLIERGLVLTAPEPLPVTLVRETVPPWVTPPELPAAAAE